MDRVFLDIQNHQAAQRAEGVVRDVADVIEGERHGLQRRQLAQSRHWDLRQTVVVQPQVAKWAKAGETSRRNAGDVVSIQVALKIETNIQVLNSDSAVNWTRSDLPTGWVKP